MASTTGPTKSPMSPNAATPPSTPNMTSRKGTWLALLITMGRTSLSIQLTTSMPHSSRPRPAALRPVSSSHTPSEPQTSGAPKGTSAITAVSTASKTGAWTPAIQ